MSFRIRPELLQAIRCSSGTFLFEIIFFFLLLSHSFHSLRRCNIKGVSYGENPELEDGESEDESKASHDESEVTKFRSYHLIGQSTQSPPPPNKSSNRLLFSMMRNLSRQLESPRLPICSLKYWLFAIP